MEDKRQRLDRETEGTMGSDEMETWNRGSQDGTRDGGPRLSNEEVAV